MYRYIFLSFDIGIRQKICSQMLHNVHGVGVFKAIHTVLCSFLAAFVHVILPDEFSSFSVSTVVVTYITDDD